MCDGLKLLSKKISSDLQISPDSGWNTANPKLLRNKCCYPTSDVLMVWKSDPTATSHCVLKIRAVKKEYLRQIDSRRDQVLYEAIQQAPGQKQDLRLNCRGPQEELCGFQISIEACARLIMLLLPLVI